MALLLERDYDESDTNWQASKKHKPRLPESQMRVDTSQLCVPYVCLFWNGGGCPKLWRDARRLAGWFLWYQPVFGINRFFFQETDDEVLSSDAFFLLWR